MFDAPPAESHVTTLPPVTGIIWGERIRTAAGGHRQICWTNNLAGHRLRDGVNLDRLRAAGYTVCAYYPRLEGVVLLDGEQLELELPREALAVVWCGETRRPRYATVLLLEALPITTKHTRSTFTAVILSGAGLVAGSEVELYRGSIYASRAERAFHGRLWDCSNGGRRIPAPIEAGIRPLALPLNLPRAVV